MSTYSIFTPPIDADKLETLQDAFNLLPNNSANLIDPHDVRSALYTVYESSPFKITNNSSSTYSYIGLDNINLRQKILIGKKSKGGSNVLSDNTLTNDIDTYFYNNKSDSNSNQSTKVGFIAGNLINGFGANVPNLYAVASYDGLYDTDKIDLYVNSSTHPDSIVGLSGSNVYVAGLKYPQKSAAIAGYTLVVNPAGTALIFTASGLSASGTVNSGSASYLAYYNSNGTILDDTKDSIQFISWNNSTGVLNIGATGSLSIGSSNTASNNNLIVGMSNTAGTYNLISGAFNYSAGISYAIINGLRNKVESANALVNGTDNYVKAVESLVNGSSHSVTGSRNVVLGYKNTNGAGSYNLISGQTNTTLYTDSYNIISGQTNTTSVTNRSIISGLSNQVYGYSYTYVNGSANMLSAAAYIISNTAIRGMVYSSVHGLNNSIELASHVHIFGAKNTIDSSAYDSNQFTLISGEGNTSYNAISSILVGSGNINTSSFYSSIFGNNNIIDYSYGSFISGEYTYTNASHSFVGGKGLTNSLVSVTGYNSFNFSYNTLISSEYGVAATASVVLGGYNQTISVTASNSVILAGNNNKIYSPSSAIISSTNSFLNTAATASVILGGYNNTSNLTYTAMIGLDSQTADKANTTYVDRFKHFGGLRRPVLFLSGTASVDETNYMVVVDTSASNVGITITSSAHNNGQEFLFINKGSNSIRIYSGLSYSVINDTISANTKKTFNCSTSGTFWI